MRRVTCLMVLAEHGEGNGDSVGFFGSSVGSVSAHIDHSANSWQGVFFWSFFWKCIYTQSHSHTVMNEQREAKIKGDVITVLCSLGWGYLKECSSQSNTCHMWGFFTLNHCIIATGRYRRNVIFGAPRIGKDTSLCCKPVLMTYIMWERHTFICVGVSGKSFWLK